MYIVSVNVDNSITKIESYEWEARRKEVPKSWLIGEQDDEFVVVSEESQ